MEGMTIEKVESELVTWVRHRAVEKRTVRIFWSSTTVVLCINRKMPLAPLMFLVPISAGKNCSEYCSPDGKDLVPSSAC